jgi:ABC-type polysaccharide/polyol phosphate export permease
MIKAGKLSTESPSISDQAVVQVKYRHYAAARASYFSELAATAKDVLASFRLYRLWSVLAFNDILGRYRGSIIGPFWITLSTAVFVAGISYMYAGLLHVSTAKYIPWMSTGVVVWNMISASISEGADAFVVGAPIIRQTAMPLPVFIWRVIIRNIMTFAHQIVIILIVALWFKYLFKINIPMFLAGLTLVCINLAWIAFFSAILSARFRDVPQVIAAILQLLFFISPVIWIPGEVAGARGALLLYNPMVHMLNVMRNPMMGSPTPPGSLEVLLVSAVVGWLLAFLFYASVRRRIVHYL